MGNRQHCILIIDDEEQILVSYGFVLKSAGYKVITESDSRKVIPLLERERISVIVLDLIMPYISGQELLTVFRNEYPNIPVIIMTASNEVETAVECMKKGAYDYIIKPVDKNRFITSVNKAVEYIELHEEVSYLKRQVLSGELQNREAFSHILTNSKKMMAIFQYAEAIAKTDKPILITGETGVGKELLAKAIYKASKVKGKFVAVNVAGLDAIMFSDTLFGHKKGSYTGALSDRAGLIAQAEGGVMLLDEIGDLPESSQLKLLRLIEEQVYYPIGSDTPRKCNVRIISITNKNLEELVKNGQFRKDLYYRLSYHSILIPPLRERKEDIPVLFEYFLQESAYSLGKKIPSYSKSLIQVLLNYDFPGNVRELKSMTYDAVARDTTGIITENYFEYIVEDIKGCHRIKTEEVPPILISKDRFPTIKEAEGFLISEALRRANGNQRIAASMLGITRQALNKRLCRMAKGQNKDAKDVASE